MSVLFHCRLYDRPGSEYCILLRGQDTRPRIREKLESLLSSYRIGMQIVSFCRPILHKAADWYEEISVGANGRGYVHVVLSFTSAATNLQQLSLQHLQMKRFTTPEVLKSLVCWKV